MTEWIVVASQAEAKIFVKRDREIVWLKTIPNPEGRSHERDFFTDRPGMNFPRMRGMGSGPYGLGTRDPHKQTLRDRFARKIAQLLEKSFEGKQFDSLKVFAEPHFLGLVRREMNNCLRKAQPLFIAKDLGHATTKDLEESIASTAVF